jgi:hypothetical protein
MEPTIDITADMKNAVTEAVIVTDALLAGLECLKEVSAVPAKQLHALRCLIDQEIEVLEKLQAQIAPDLD